MTTLRFAKQPTRIALKGAAEAAERHRIGVESLTGEATIVTVVGGDDAAVAEAAEAAAAVVMKAVTTCEARVGRAINDLLASGMRWANQRGTTESKAMIFRWQMETATHNRGVAAMSRGKVTNQATSAADVDAVAGARAIAPIDQGRLPVRPLAVRFHIRPTVQATTTIWGSNSNR
jgi:hypothetical protein